MEQENSPPPLAPPQEVDVWHRTEEHSLINLVPFILQDKFIEAQKKEPGLFGHDERALYKMLRGSNRQPTPTDNRLRLAFWVEYDRAQAANEKMNLAYVYSGVCLQEYFKFTYLNLPAKVAWLICPPTSYEVTLKEGVSFGLKVMRDILDEDPADYPMGQRVKFKELQAKIFAMLDMREKGAFTQRSEVKQMNLNVSTNDKAVAGAMIESNVDALEKRMKQLERQERQAQNLVVKDDITVK